MTVRVVKLGGSLAHSDELPKWLDVVATNGAGRVVLVPGGGPWANQVRAAQKREGFDDRVAHRKALRAMEQFGKSLAGMRANLVPSSSLAEIHEVLHGYGIPVWMPFDMVVADKSIPESWDITSDSLAAWLAGGLNASALLLVKSLKIDGPQPGVEEMMRRGWVDPAFAKFTSGVDFRIVLLGRGDQNAAASLLMELDAGMETSRR
jgi:aspartokinase-like uncharacterized kinase